MTGEGSQLLESVLILVAEGVEVLQGGEGSAGQDAVIC